MDSGNFHERRVLEKSVSIRKLLAKGLQYWKEQPAIGLVKTEGDAVESKKLIQKGLK